MKFYIIALIFFSLAISPYLFQKKKLDFWFLVGLIYCLIGMGILENLN